jgi:hypothetical protein
MTDTDPMLDALLAAEAEMVALLPDFAHMASRVQALYAVIDALAPLYPLAEDGKSRMRPDMPPPVTQPCDTAVTHERRTQ